MSQVQVVPSIYIQQLWDKVEKFLSDALVYSGGEYDVEHLKQYLVQGNQTLLIAVDENNVIHGAATVEWGNYPNERIAFITAIGGKMLANKELYSQFEDWIRQNGGTMVRGAARESIARLWRRAFQFEQRYIIVEKKL